ncbi:hypothetical protein HYT33_03220 [Candidatus Roizmanbacteria bacterium]|nr:hypothetical protein [Candidatus Roizmanbacteria bacterium]
MRYSQLFGKAQKNISQQFEARSHELLVKAGFIDQVASGIYTFLVPGKRVLTNIENIIREEMNAIGAQEILMPTLHPKSLWEQTGRWNNVDVLFKTKSRFGQEYGIGPTHEEVITPLVRKFVKSYRDLPLGLYHISAKFRDEPRPKSGILRGREFGMKDLYSFHINHTDLQNYYQIVTKAYLTIFTRLGLGNVKVTEASGGTFTKKYSHEFNVLTPAGEVDLVYCATCSFAQNEEISSIKKNEKCPKCKKGTIKVGKAIEVGNIFDLETKFSTAFELTYADRDGKQQPVVMGCYGIGTTRLVGAIVELYNDEKGIVWPDAVAPYQAHLVELDASARSVYEKLTRAKIEVLYDE